MHSIFPGWLWLTKCAVGFGFALSANVVLAQGSLSVPPPKLNYHSVWAHYQGFMDQPVTSWRQSNDTVERAGGWQSYAREARQPDIPANSDTKPVTPSVSIQQGDKP